MNIYCVHLCCNRKEAAFVSMDKGEEAFDVLITDAGHLGIQFGTVHGRCQVLKVLPLGLIAQSEQVEVGDLLDAIDGEALEPDEIRGVLMQGLRPVRLGFVRPHPDDVVDAVATPTELILRAQRSELEVLRHWGALHFEMAAAEAAAHTTGDLAQKDALTQTRVREFIANVRAARDGVHTDESAPANQLVSIAQKHGLEWGWTMVCSMAGGERGTPALFRQAASFTGTTQFDAASTPVPVRGVMWLSALWAPRPLAALVAGSRVEVNCDGLGVWVGGTVQSVLPDDRVSVVVDGAAAGEARAVSQLRVRHSGDDEPGSAGQSSALPSVVAGWVWKKKSRTNKWQKRWLLVDSRIRYFKKETDGESEESMKPPVPLDWLQEITVPSTDINANGTGCDVVAKGLSQGQQIIMTLRVVDGDVGSGRVLQRLHEALALKKIFAAKCHARSCVLPTSSATSGGETEGNAWLAQRDHGGFVHCAYSMDGGPTRRMTGTVDTAGHAALVLMDDTGRSSVTMEGSLPPTPGPPLSGPARFTGASGAAWSIELTASNILVEAVRECDAAAAAANAAKAAAESTVAALTSELAEVERLASDPAALAALSAKRQAAADAELATAAHAEAVKRAGADRERRSAATRALNSATRAVLAARAARDGAVEASLAADASVGSLASEEATQTALKARATKLAAELAALKPEYAAKLEEATAQSAAKHAAALSALDAEQSAACDEVDAEVECAQKQGSCVCMCMCVCRCFCALEQLLPLLSPRSPLHRVYQHFLYLSRDCKPACGVGEEKWKLWPAPCRDERRDRRSKGTDRRAHEERGFVRIGYCKENETREAE